jgi:hypothetical protein
MISIPARMLLVFYVTFLVFYFVPWNLKNIEKLDLLEVELKQNYGQINALDEMEITLSQLFSFICVVISLLSAAKSSYMAIAPARFDSNVCLYPLAVFVSIVVSVLTHETFPQSILYNSGSWSMLIQPLLAVSRGFIFYRVLFSAPRTIIKASSEEELKKASIPPKLTTFAYFLRLSANVWFFTYWSAYVILGCFFYNEIVKYIVEEHIDLKTIMNFILV